MYRYEEFNSDGFASRVEMLVATLKSKGRIASVIDFWKSLGFKNVRSTNFVKKQERSDINNYRMALSIGYEYQEVNVDWLITGNGTMFDKTNSNISYTPIVSALESNMESIKELTDTIKEFQNYLSSYSDQ